MEFLSQLSLAGALVFAYLWRVTPPDATYELSEGGEARKRTAFLACGIACLATWLACVTGYFEGR